MADFCNGKSSGIDDENKVFLDSDIPVEEVSQGEPPTEQNVKEAIDELNPTIDSLGQRG